MKLRHIEFFCAVVEQGSISKAAQALYITQQSVSKGVRQLEQELGCELLERRSDGVSPTRVGRILYDEFRDIQDRIDQIPQNIARGLDSKERLPIVVAYGVLGSLTTGVIDGFMATHPNVDLEVTDAPDLTVESKVLSGEAELGIGVGPVDSSTFDAHLLKRERMWLCIHRDNPLYERESLTMADLRDARFLNMGPLFKANAKLRTSCEAHGFEPTVAFTSNEIVTLKEMSERNIGMMIVPTSKAYSSCPDVRFVPYPDDYFSYSLFLIRRRGRPLSRAAKDVASYLEGLYAGREDELV